MIYFDNAATTMPKPPEVVRAVTDALQSFGGVGRGVHAPALTADSAVYQARCSIAQLLGAPSASQVAFACNATEALNTAICGLLSPGDHAVTTAASHNSVLRPLYCLRDEGRIALNVAPVGPDGALDYDAFDALFRADTRMAVVTHASNLTGDVYDVGRMARIAHRHGALIVVDAAQTAGTFPVDMGAMDLDVLAFTGHKGLFGPQGTGGLCVAEGVEIRPLKVGGSGVRSFDERHPAFMPERLEAGTLNAHGIAGLGAGVGFILDKGLDAVSRHDLSLAARFRDGANSIPGVRVLGGGADDHCAIVALNAGDCDSGLIARRLDDDFGICTRSGAHCAPLMHRALGTEEQGAVRFSFSYFNTDEEVDVALDALERITAEELSYCIL